ncbi:MAG: hypothetical protein ACTSYA_13310 [Candidatus Kariarchaeaceae archaeon]
MAENEQTLVERLSVEDINKTKVLEQHFKEIPFNQEVAEGQKSYSEIVEFISDYYGSVLAKIVSPPEYQELDTQVEGVVRAINAVGLYKLDPTDYTTIGWKRKMRERETGILGGVGVAGGVFSLIPNKDEEGTSKVSWKTKIGLGITSLVLGYGSAKYWHFKDITANLELLENAGKETQKYLREIVQD